MDLELLTDDLDATPVGGPRLAYVGVEGLFGRYNHSIEVPLDDQGLPGRLLLLYGENGSGKTTVLRLLWNLLSPADDSGHRTNIALTPFRTMRVGFSDGTWFKVEKLDGLIGSFTLSASTPRAELITARYTADASGTIPPRSEREAPVEIYYNRIITQSASEQRALRRHSENLRSQDEFVKFLGTWGRSPLLLADDRVLYSDDPAIDRARERASYEFESLAGRRRADESVVERELTLSIGRVNEFLRSLTLSGQSQGSAGVNSIYIDVLRRLASTGGVDPDPASRDMNRDLRETTGMLNTIQSNSPRFEEFGLVPRFNADEVALLLQRIPAQHQSVAHSILLPYLDSLIARMQALDEAEGLVRTLVSLLNRFLVDKSATFTPTGGLRITSATGDELSPKALSSGERQLVMLASTTLLARNSSRIFLIDEPELSLGVRWQREILSSLLELTRGSSLQFIVATHSVEMISSERRALVRLQRPADESQI